MTRFLWAAAVTVVALAPAARAEGVKIEVVRQKTVRTVYDNPHLFDDLARAWDQKRTELDRAIEGELTKLNPKLPRKVNFARQHSELAKARVTTHIDRGQGLAPVPVVRVEFEAKHNVLTTRFTTPTVLGSYADPEFKVTYDLHAVIFVPVKEKIRTLTITGAEFEVRNVHITPENASAHVIDFASDVYRLLTGKDYKAIGQRMLSQKIDLKDRVNKLLAPVNKELQKVTSANTKVTVSQRNGIVIRVADGMAAPKTPPVIH